MEDLKVYSPKEARVIINGIDITGWADGEKIKVEPVTKEVYKSHTGTDGDVTYTENHDERHTLTMMVKQSSPSNVLLEGFLKEKASFTASISNARNGKFIGGGLRCRIMERPSYMFGMEEKAREWKITIPNFSGATLPEN